ncbi:hypothetical protein [Burkholderia mayonis]|uniref:Uncharacterized protein n=1 Tax=Burkholderia mayonis TaxID=1385591 RepID=A0A1B4FU89_9BURK|nr:hypothetical protein [Burkholderia mayonis]AOJ07242.1 hypothetical protein WS71_07915 [Burkholderia mayonis]KVE47699.1 hypothetical protein WS71_19260 [Burkholderia mayonis]
MSDQDGYSGKREAAKPRSRAGKSKNGSAGNLGFETIVAGDTCVTFDSRDLSGRLWSAEEVMRCRSAIAMDYARALDAADVVVLAMRQH